MSVKENKELLVRYVDEVLNKQNMVVHDQISDPGIVIHYNNNDLNREQFKTLGQSILAAFPDIKYTIGDLFGEGDQIAGRWTSIGTHKGKFMGFAATGKKIKNSGLGIYKIKERKLVEMWIITDRLSMMEQLGLSPALARARA